MTCLRGLRARCRKKCVSEVPICPLSQNVTGWFMWLFWSMQTISGLGLLLLLLLNCSKLWEFAIHNVAENRGGRQLLLCQLSIQQYCYFIQHWVLFFLNCQVRGCLEGRCVIRVFVSEDRQWVFVHSLNIFFSRKENDNLKEITTFWKGPQNNFHSRRPQRDERKWRRKMVFLALHVVKNLCSKASSLHTNVQGLDCYLHRHNKLPKFSMHLPSYKSIRWQSKLECSWYISGRLKFRQCSFQRELFGNWLELRRTECNLVMSEEQAKIPRMASTMSSRPLASTYWSIPLVTPRQTTIT